MGETVEDLVAAAEALRDEDLEDGRAEALYELVLRMADIATTSQEELERTRVDPRYNADLARAVLHFAEWQKVGYERSDQTREVIGSQLWQEVSDLVTITLGCAPESLGVDASGLVSPEGGRPFAGGAGRSDGQALLGFG